MESGLLVGGGVTALALIGMFGWCVREMRRVVDVADDRSPAELAAEEQEPDSK